MVKIATVNYMIYHKFANEILPLLENVNKSLKVAVSVSGGSDSMALCFLLRQFLKEHDGELYCVTIDHQLRQESGEEAKKLGEVLKLHNLNHIIIPWLGSKPVANIQEEARIARYNLLIDYCKTHNINYLATGHQKNDQAENFIIRVEHGAGLYGLAGIPKINDYKGVKILRPLLEFNKEELQEFLKQNNISWIEDPSNYNDKFTRTKARNVLKQYPSLVEKLATISRNLAKAKDAIEYFLNKSIEKIVEFDAEFLSLDLLEFNKLPQEIRFRMLERLLQNFSNAPKPARGERIENLLEKIEMGQKFKASTLSGCLILRKKDKIIIKLEV